MNINPINPIINTRSFGERPDLVSEISAQVIRTLKDEGVLSTAKHFPDHVLQVFLGRNREGSSYGP